MRSGKEILWERQNKALRHPSEIFGGPFENSGITKQTLKFNASKSFVKLLHDLNITLVVSREYENLLLALQASSRSKIDQTFFHLPHPSGIAVDRTKNVVYVAATRNPNQIVEFKLAESKLVRTGIKSFKNKQLIPSRVKYYPGQYYFHDLIYAKGKLYANSVGMNSIVPVDMSKKETEQPIWWPKCIEKNKKPATRANYIQLNSIAFNKSIQNSYFSASGKKPGPFRPGHSKYPVDKQGVIFSGKTREPIAFGLTRPHSARLYKGKIWVANSGYGEVGYIQGKEFKPVFKFDGWTRGLCFIGDVLFIAISRVLPRFKQYAPGIKSVNQTCSIVALDTRKLSKIGEIKFPYGNQIFAIDYLKGNDFGGFPFTTIKKSGLEEDIFSVFL